MECPSELKAQLDSALERLNYLICRINLTNASTMIEGKSLTEILALKDSLSLKVRQYRDIIDEASRVNYRARGGEIKFKSTIEVSAWQKECDDTAKQLRLVDNQLQMSNWSVDLKE